MPGYIVTIANKANCTHQGVATPAPPTGRVMIMGAAAVTLAHTYAIVGCGYPAATSGAQPACLAAKITAGSLRVTTMGVAFAVLPLAPPTLCTPTGLPLLVMPLQTRVFAT
jgi:hypothetical protein